VVVATLTRILQGSLISGLASAALLAQPASDQKGLVAALEKALNADSAIRSSANEIRLGEPVRLSGTGAGVVRVQYQLGTVDGKAAFVEFTSAAASARNVEADVKGAIAELSKSGPRRLGSGAQIQFCAGARVCVRSCKTSSASFCCRWECRR
jgi:hypothetical protein